MSSTAKQDLIELVETLSDDEVPNVRSYVEQMRSGKDPAVIDLAEEMGPEEYARFRKRVASSLAQARAGETIPAERALEELRRRRTK